MPVSRTAKRSTCAPGGTAGPRQGRGRLRFDPDAHRDLALLGELDGVAHQVHQRLAQAAGVAAQDVGDAVLDGGRQRRSPSPWPGGRRGE